MGGVAGNVVGRIQSWNPTGLSREGDWIYELNNRTWGKPVDYVPGRATNFSVTATVAELWFKEIEVQLGLTAEGTQFNDLIEPPADNIFHRAVFALANSDDLV